MMKIVRTCIFVFLGSVLLPVHAVEWQALPDKAPAPADNPTTAAKAELGQMLFMDPRFSSTGTVERLAWALEYCEIQGLAFS